MLQQLKTLGTDLKNKNFIKYINVFLMNNCIATNRKAEQFYFSLTIGPNEVVQQENINILGEILVSLFSCLFNPFPE